MGDRNKRKMRAPVWEYFLREGEGTIARCTICQKTLKTTNGGTSSLVRHLQSHGIFLANDGPATKRQCLSVNVNRDISKLAAQDGLSFLTIAHSEIIRNAYEKANGVKLPSSPNTVRECILKYSSEIRESMKIQIADLRAKGFSFGVTLDEWTSLGNRRFLNCNLHANKKVFNLGLIRIRGSATAELVLGLLKIKLEQFGINLDSREIISLITDGAQTMQKLGRISGKKLQLCLAHGVHLAITDVLYKKNRAIEGEDEEDANEDMNVEVDGEDDDEDGEDDDEEEEAEEGNNWQLEDAKKIVYRDGLSALIGRVRKVVKFFKKSALKSEVLNKYSGSEEAKSLILDCRTRWNSLLAMLERVLLMQHAIKMAFIDLREPDILSDEDFNSISNIVSALKPVQVAAEAFCRRDADLIVADVSIAFMLDKLQSESSSIATELLLAIIKRLKERRTYLSDVLSYLHYRSEENGLNTLGHFDKINRSALTSALKEIYELCKPCTEVSQNADLFCSQAEDESSTTLEMSLEVELSLAISKAQTFQALPSTSRRDSISSIASIKREMLSFEATGIRGQVLSTVYKALMSIPPSTVESERVFSSANSFNTKLRSKLGDKALDVLVFLRSFFLNNK